MRATRNKLAPVVRSTRKRLVKATARTSAELQTLQCFRTIFGSARTHDAEVRRSTEISGSQLWALSEIVARSGTTVNGLAEQMALHQTTASNLVNSLVVRKLVRRVRDGVDRRVIRLHASVEGKRTLLKLPGPHAGILFDAIRHLEADELLQLRTSLGTLVSLMRRTAGDAAGEPLMGE